MPFSEDATWILTYSIKPPLIHHTNDTVFAADTTTELSADCILVLYDQCDGVVVQGAGTPLPVFADCLLYDVSAA